MIWHHVCASDALGVPRQSECCSECLDMGKSTQLDDHYESFRACRRLLGSYTFWQRYFDLRIQTDPLPLSTTVVFTSVQPDPGLKASLSGLFSGG